MTDKGDQKDLSVVRKAFHEAMTGSVNKPISEEELVRLSKIIQNGC